MTQHTAPSPRPRHRALPWLLPATLALTAASGALAAEAPVPEGVLMLSATATVDLPHDWMSVSFTTNREGGDAATVQNQLKQAVDTALAEARKLMRPGQVEVQTGAFSIYPRYGQKGQLTGWQGSTELLVEGRDMAAIAQLSGRINTLTIARVGYSLSREAREKVEAEVSALAIARFRARAAEHAKQFGYAGYVVREVNVTVDQAPGPMPMPRVAMAMAKSADAEALPVEAGKGSVSASVNGSVQMK